MRIPIPENRKKLLDIFYPYLYCPKGEHGMHIRDDAPDEAKKAFEEFLKLPKDPSFDTT